ncbi:arf-GAP domain and FG repeat-containing protein 1 [Orussus abietinus]|uniref:arf-GAP domain and FG repeat-containing protein 1 n=1 Tax=Orussus abietinus TaxID=222816 RepID=UPI000625CEE1|nr:arf-GAP domain and FG repeat-containing protein 1 [Orussus abietinus]
MASAKRKQDEKNLKILRELVSQPGNKECFDCGQRGPTYVNMTIGSFVCTSCSGMLRGLTPPHRVKSISMATFTQEEIDLIKERGNEYCRRIWLGLMDPNSPHNVDLKDEQKMKDLMTAKYELKRFYLDPSLSPPSQTTSQKSTPSSNTRTNQTSIPRVPLSGTSTTLSMPIQKAKNPEPIDANAFTPDFVADFSKVPDPFLAATPTSNFGQPFIPQPSFANFDNNPVFNSVKGTETTMLTNQTAGTFTATFNGTTLPPSEDRYAALKDLDSLMKQAHLKEDTPKTLSTSAWDLNNSNASNTIWSGNNPSNHVISNPFTGEDLWRPSVNFVNNNMQSMDSSLCNSANPFRPMQFPVNNDHSQWTSSPSNGDIIPSSQLMPTLSNKVWQPSVTAYQANPFMVGSGVSNMVRNTNNPFL